MHHPDLLGDHSHFADAGVFRIRPDLALVQTVDFFPPIVDDPRDFGRIAAANALSDCYAMGGRPLTALSVAGFPSRELPAGTLGDILAGGAEKVLEAGAVVVGGHTVEDAEVKYGLCITGTVHPDRVISNEGARPGQKLVLTKPLGMGTLATALKKGKLSTDLLRAGVELMATLNLEASELMVELGATGATDITGFGLLGHAYEVAEASGVTLRIHPESVPILPGVSGLAAAGYCSGGVRKNRSYAASHVSCDGMKDPLLEDLLFDAETSGGLLIALPGEQARELVERLKARGHLHCAVVGEVLERQKTALELRPAG
jgi:selenide,water dikinase